MTSLITKYQQTTCSGFLTSLVSKRHVFDKGDRLYLLMDLLWRLYFTLYKARNILYVSLPLSSFFIIRFFISSQKKCVKVMDFKKF